MNYQVAVFDSETCRAEAVMKMFCVLSLVMDLILIYI